MRVVGVVAGLLYLLAVLLLVPVLWIGAAMVGIVRGLRDLARATKRPAAAPD